MERQEYQRTLQKHVSIAQAASENMDLNYSKKETTHRSTTRIINPSNQQIQNHQKYNGILQRRQSQIQQLEISQKSSKMLQSIQKNSTIAQKSGRNIVLENQKQASLSPMKKKTIIKSQSPVKKKKIIDVKQNTIYKQKQLIDQITSDNQLQETENENNGQSKQNSQQQQNHNVSKHMKTESSVRQDDNYLTSRFSQGQLPLNEKRYHYYGGSQPYEIIVKMRGMEYNEQLLNEYEPYQILDSRCILVKSQEDINNHKSIMQNLSKDKILQFSTVYSQKHSNEHVYRHSFQEMCKQFLNAQNQSVIFYGGENSGKSRAVFGNLRDPGFIPIMLKDLFNELYDSPDCEDIVFKFSFINFDVEKGEFHDLLVNSKHPLQLTEDNISDIHLIGGSECIVNNLKTALKLYRSALLNLYGDVQGTPEEQERISQSNFIMQIKAELPPKDSMGSEILVSKLKVIKICSQEQQKTNKKRKFEKEEQDEVETNVPQALRKVIKTLSDFTHKTKKNSYIPYKINPLMEYLIDSLSGNSFTYFYLCINNLEKYGQQTHQYLRTAQHAQNINTNPQITKISFPSLDLQYAELKEEIRKTLYVWLMEFGHNETDLKKKKRQFMIFKHLNKIEQVFQNILPYYENLALLNSQLNSLYAVILQNYCQAFSKQITCENLQEFYLAKLQQYLIKEIRIENGQGIYFCNLIIEEIVECKLKISMHFKNLKKSLVLWENKDKKPQFINNYDVEKFVGIGRMCKKWLEILDSFANYNHYDAEKFNGDFVQIFQRTKQVFIDLQNQEELESSEQGMRGYKWQNNNGNPFQEQDNESDNNQTFLNNNNSLSSQERNSRQQQQLQESSQQQNNQSSKQVKNTEISEQNINSSKSQVINNMSISLADKNNQSSNKLMFQTKKQQMDQLRQTAEQMIKRIKQKLTDTKQQKYSRKQMENLQNQDFFYVKNHKIRTGRHNLLNIKKQQRIATLGSEESQELDDDLVKNLFSNELLKIKSKVFEQQYNQNQDQKQYFDNLTRAKSTAAICYKPYLTSNSFQNTNIQTNQTVKRPFYLNGSQSKSQKKQHFNTQNSPQMQHRIIKGLNQNPKNFTNAAQQINNNNKYSKINSSNQIQDTLTSPSNRLQSYMSYQNSQDNLMDSISKQDYSDQKAQIYQMQFEKQKQMRLKKARENKMPILIGLEKFKFKLPQIEHSSLNDQIMCNKFNIQQNNENNNNSNNQISKVNDNKKIYKQQQQNNNIKIAN